MNILMLNGLFLFTLLMLTSAELEPETEPIEEPQHQEYQKLLMLTSGKLQPETEPIDELQHQEYQKGRRLAIQVRRKACKNLGGECIRRRKDCPNNLPLQTPPGRPYCSRRRYCCYPEPATDVPTTGSLISIGDTKTWDDVACQSQDGIEAKCSLKHGDVTKIHDWCYIGPGTDDWDYCTGHCTVDEIKSFEDFEKKHNCKQVDAGADTGKPCQSVADANAFANSEGRFSKLFTSFNNPAAPFQIAYVKNNKGTAKEDTCIMVEAVQTWACNRENTDHPWECINGGMCRGGFTVKGGHYPSNSLHCP